MIERRKSERVQVYLEAEWEGDLGIRSGTVGDIGVGGCYVMTGGDVKERELIRLRICLPEEELCLWGEVANYVPEIGFGLRFTAFDDAARTSIERLVQYVRERQSAKGPECNETGIERTVAIPQTDASLSEVQTTKGRPSAAPDSKERTTEIAQLRDLPPKTKTLIAKTLLELRELMDKLQKSDSKRPLALHLSKWFKLAQGSIGVLPYGELRRSLREAATVIRLANDLHDSSLGAKNADPSLRYVEQYYGLELIPDAERPAHLLKEFVSTHYDQAAEICRASNISLES
jgi:hypothetical protein